MEFRETEEFKKEFKGLKRKYQTLEADLAVLKKTIAIQPSGDGSKHWNRLATDHDSGVHIFKIRMMCRAVRGSQFRVIYAYREKQIEILFVELYFKGKKENEDKERVREYFELLRNIGIE